MTLPTFFVIGAAKSGTTSLYHYLDEHPEVFMSPVKETNHFASAEEASGQGRVAGPDEYEALYEGAGGATAVGEASPLYLRSRVAAERIHRAVPDARIIAILRNPTDRAYSGYLMQVRKGRERRPIGECFERGDVYIEAGFYADDLARFYERFDRRGIRIYLFDELVADPQLLMSDLFTFLGVDGTFRVGVEKRYNVGGMPRRRWLANFGASGFVRWLRDNAPESGKRLGRGVRDANLEKPPPMPPELRERLRELYREDIERVQELTGKDLSAWE